MQKSLLLISQRAEDIEFATAVAEESGLSLKIEADPLKAAEILVQDEAHVVFADLPSHESYRKLEAAISETMGLFSDKINANAFHFISSENLENVPYLLQSPIFGHFVLRNYGIPRQAGLHYGRIVRATLAPKAFGLANLLQPGSKIQVVKLPVSSHKQDAVEAIKNYLVAAKFQSRMATSIANAVDELLMNSIFDAPVDELGKPLLSATSRSSAFALEGRNSVEMNVGFDGDHVAISSVDLFGSLDKAKLLHHISKIYTEQEYKVKTATAGAGIGLATVFRSGGSFFFVSEAQAMTEVTVIFKRTDNFREFKDQFRFISTQFYY